MEFELKNSYSEVEIIWCDSSESQNSFTQQIFIQQFSETHSCDCKTHQNTSLETSAQVATSVVLLNENVRPGCTCHTAVSKHDCTGKMKNPNVAIYAVHALSVVLGSSPVLFSM